MDDVEAGRLRLALSLMSGRILPAMLDREQLELLGYELNRFGQFGTPSVPDLLERAEEIVYGVLTEGESPGSGWIIHFVSKTEVPIEMEQRTYGAKAEQEARDFAAFLERDGSYTVHSVGPFTPQS